MHIAFWQGWWSGLANSDAELKLAILSLIFNQIPDVFGVTRDQCTSKPPKKIWKIRNLICKWVHSRKLTCPLKRNYFNRKYIFQPLIFRGHSLVFRGVDDNDLSPIVMILFVSSLQIVYRYATQVPGMPTTWPRTLENTKKAWMISPKPFEPLKKIQTHIFSWTKTYIHLVNPLWKFTTSLKKKNIQTLVFPASMQ